MLLMLHLSGSSYITGEDVLQDDCDITAIFHHSKANTTPTHTHTDKKHPRLLKYRELQIELAFGFNPQYTNHPEVY